MGVRLRRGFSLDLKHVWDQLFTVNTIWNIGETGDINIDINIKWHCKQQIGGSTTSIIL